jgi:cyclopropane-fatty-acyl-phospholipid synthase
MNGFDIDTRFDRVVSVEMFEHMRNWGQLFSRVNHWLKPGGKLFMHVFCHRDTPYFFESQGPGDWMASHFFSGGMMPSAGLPLYFQQHLQYQNSWVWNGNHYARTLAAWLKAHDSKALEISEVIYDIYGLEGSIWGQRWRLFYMACEELFRMNNGNEWFVVHYLMQKPDGRHG